MCSFVVVDNIISLFVLSFVVASPICLIVFPFDCLYLFVLSSSVYSRLVGCRAYSFMVVALLVRVVVVCELFWLTLIV